MTVTQTPVESIRRIDVSVRPVDADEDSSLATVSGFYGAAVAPPGSTLVSWQGAGSGGPPGPGTGTGDEDDRNGDGNDPPPGQDPAEDPPGDEPQNGE